MEVNGVMGEWKDFEIKRITEAQFPEVLKQLREYFYKDEPIQQIIGMTDERANDSDKRAAYFLTHNLSFMATEKNSGQIAGVMIIGDYRKDKAHPEFEQTCPLSRALRSVMIKLENTVNIFSRFEVDQYAEIHTISVSLQFRGAGLATEMYRRGISFLADKGYSLIMSEFSNPLSRKIGDKFGFQEVTRLYFVDLMDDNGVRLMESATPEQFVNITVLKLKD